MTILNKPPRVMWLINHTTLRSFEMEQFKAVGVEEIFLPKSFHYNEGNLSATVTFDWDSGLNIPAQALKVLNEQDWYTEPSEEAWEIANRYFDVVFIPFFSRQVQAAVKHFRGAIVLRVFGLTGGATYSGSIRHVIGGWLDAAIRQCGKRFFFGMGYKHLADCELPLLADRAVFLPVGLKGEKHFDDWEGRQKHIFFVCPRIGSSSYFNTLYKKFLHHFGDMPYSIGGAQPAVVNDSKVLGFVSKEVHESNMKESRVMFYHSQEPNHIHYHPFEAIRAGMPLVFMAGGMLDQMGGKHLPGRCKNWREARRKIQRILNDDWALIQKIRTSQPVLLQPIESTYCQPIWAAGFQHILKQLSQWRTEQAERPLKSSLKRIAVILPIAYRGGTLRGAQLLAKALYLGSRKASEDVEVVLLHPNTPDYSEADFIDLPATISRRPYDWKKLSSTEAQRAMHYAGLANWEPVEAQYIVPDDGIQHLQDCHLWLFVSDRLSVSVLPLKPIALMIYDYLQRYEPALYRTALTKEQNRSFLNAARNAERVFVTTDFTYRDAMQYAGLEPHKVCKLPMLTPEFSMQSSDHQTTTSDYFIWPTNPAAHKNHLAAAEALRIYYEELEGQLACWVTGNATNILLTAQEPYLVETSKIFKQSKRLRQQVKWKGELSDMQYRACLARARFLWHAGRMDNGTFCVVEAAALGVPALSSDYPAMREMDAQFSLNLAWMDPYSPRNMAEQLKHMEQAADLRRQKLPNASQLQAHQTETLALTYWKEVRKCL